MLNEDFAAGHSAIGTLLGQVLAGSHVDRKTWGAFRDRPSLSISAHCDAAFGLSSQALGGFQRVAEMIGGRYALTASAYANFSSQVPI